MAIGRISGSMLKSNLTRNGVDLAFETNILYLDVTNARVGIGTSTPLSTLDVAGDTHIQGSVYPSAILETYSNTPYEFTVTLGTKTANNLFYGQGSSDTFFINGLEAPFIDLLPNKKYRFNQSDFSNTGHTFKLYYDQYKSREFPDYSGTTVISYNGTPGSAGAYTDVYIDSPVRPSISYQSAAGNLVGNWIQLRGIGGGISVAAEDSTARIIGSYETITFAGGNNISTSITTDGSDILTITGSKDININSITSDDSTAIQVNDGLNVSGTITATGLVAGGLTYPTYDGSNGQVMTTNGSGVLGFTSLSEFTGITFVGDDSSGSTINTAETLKFLGASGITTSVVDDTVTITGPNLSSYLTNSPITVVGDDSTGTTLNTGETIKIAGAGGITTAVSGDVLTITGANQAQGITFVGDDSTGTRISDGETLKIAGTSNITTAVSGDTLTITGPNLSGYLTSVPKDIDVNSISSGDSTAIQINDGLNVSGTLTANSGLVANGITYPTTDGTPNQVLVTNGSGILSFTSLNSFAGITFVGDDSTGSTINTAETLKFTGSNNITTTVIDDTVTITGSKDINVNSISSGDSSAIQINDNVNVSGTFNAKTIVTNDLISEDSTAINVLDGMNVSGTLSADVLDVNEISSSDSSAIQINDSLNASGIITAASFVTHGTSGNITGVNNIEVNQISSNDSTAVQVADGLNVSGTLTASTIVTNDISSGDSTAVQINDAVNIAGTLSVGGNVISNVSDPVANQDAATKNYVDSQLSGGASTSFFVADDTSTVTTIDSGSTFRVIGAGSVTTALDGDTITITGSGGATNFTFIGDDSTGTTLAGGDTLQVLGGEGISTAVIGNVLTITNTSTQLEIDGGSAYSVYNAISEALIDGGTA